ncbi:MAG TPA: glycosyltransferase [Gemmatimonadaceae bacterium]|nr:glycosyltransferase [Gemmatimonadaceae bacterium]
MIDPRWFMVAAPAAPLAVATWLYPAVLSLYARPDQADASSPPDPAEWPTVSIVLSAYNAESVIARTLDQLLATDYPRERLQILIVSDGSTDATEAIVQRYADRGVELLVVPRGGKTLAENQAAAVVRGEIVVGTDASIIVYPNAVRVLVRRLIAEPRLGVVSGRALVVPHAVFAEGATAAMSAVAPSGGYYDFLNRLRLHEQRLGGTVGATGGLYAQRRDVFNVALPPQVTRDMACTLIARELGYGSAQENGACCLWGQAASLSSEYRRHVRTIINGLDTLWHFRRLLNPRRGGVYAWQLWGHKVSRSLIYPACAIAAVGLVSLVASSSIARVLFAAGVVVLATGLAFGHSPQPRPKSRYAAAFAPACVGLTAGLAAWWSFARGRHAVTWEPTPRGSSVENDAQSPAVIAPTV